MNTNKQVFVQWDVEFFEHMLENGIVGSWGRSTLSFMSILCTDFHKVAPSCEPTSGERGFIFLLINLSFYFVLFCFIFSVPILMDTM